MKRKQSIHSESGIPSTLLGEAENNRRYPEIYFRLQPDIVSACDEMIKLSPRKPSQELVERMTDQVYNSVSGKYPELAKYAADYETHMLSSPLSISLFGMEIKGRGLFRNLIAFLLLAEFFRRRRCR